jgi:hypothetical protein
MKNAKTTILGICTIVTAVASAIMALIDSNPATNFDIATVVAAIMAGVGLIMAKDADPK